MVDAVGQWLGDESHLNAGCTLERRSYLELDAADPVVRKLLNRQAFDDIDEDEGLDLSKVPMKSRIVIVSGNSDAELRPHDVGMGISQVVPVIVTALDGEERLLAIEQPELHIHPRLQAAIADLFIESIHKNRHRFIIETHSEHLILRLLRRIRETENGTAPVDRQLRTNELGIYYLKQENGSSTASFGPIHIELHAEAPDVTDLVERNIRQERVAYNMGRKIEGSLKAPHKVELCFWPKLLDRVVVAGNFVKESDGTIRKSPRWGVSMNHVARGSEPNIPPTEWKLLRRDSLTEWFRKFVSEDAASKPSAVIISPRR